MLETPRPSAVYWRAMLFYTVSVFWVKFAWQLGVWEWAVPDGFHTNEVMAPQDPYKLGFVLSEKTDSQSFFAYTIWDILCLLALVSHEYILIKSGLATQTQEDVTPIETYMSLPVCPVRVKTLHDLGPGLDFEALDDYDNISEPDSNSRAEWMSEPPTSFLQRLIPRNSLAKPGADLYTYTVVIQVLILLSIVILYTNMEGVTEEWELSLR